jgi:hypothetical protein
MKKNIFHRELLTSLWGWLLARQNARLTY